MERILNCFESEQQIEQQNNSKFRIISICNWDKYQNNEQQIEQPVNSHFDTAVLVLSVKLAGFSLSPRSAYVLTSREWSSL